MLSAPRVRLTGDELRGVEAVTSDGRALTGALRLAGAGPASNVVVAPRQLRRELLVGARTVVETVVLPERTAGAVVQWLPGPGPETATEVTGVLPDGAAALSEDGGCVTLHREDGGVLLCRLFATAVWDSPERLDGEVRLTGRVTLREGEPVTVVVAAGEDEADARAALSTTARGGVHERRAEGALDAARRERPALHTGVAELDDALEWAKARMEGHAGPSRVVTAGSTADPLLPVGLAGALRVLGLAASGDHDGARHVLDGLDPAEPGTLLAAGWTAAWTGAAPGWSTDRTAEAGRAALAVAADPSSSTPAEVRVVARAAVVAAGELLAGLGDRAAGETLVAELPAEPVPVGRRGGGGSNGGDGSTGEDGPTGEDGSTGEDGRDASTGGDGPDGRKAVRLPVLGTASDSPPTSSPTSLLGTVLGVPTDPPWPGPDATAFDAEALSEDPVRSALEAWACFRTDRFDAGYLGVRAHLSRAGGTAETPGARGCWGRGDHADDPVATALVPVLVLHALLGAEPDAPFGRLRLAPALPASWTRFRVTGVRLGRASLELACRRGGGRHTFVLRPTAGPVPATVVFEPRVPGRVVSVEVDGEPSDVIPEPPAPPSGRGRARLQLPLDRDREVTLVGSDD